jgi:hypothetical protein
MRDLKINLDPPEFVHDVSEVLVHPLGLASTAWPWTVRSSLLIALCHLSRKISTFRDVNSFGMRDPRCET